MKKVIVVLIIATTAFACKKTERSLETPIRYYFKIEAIDTDGPQSTITTYKSVIVN
jgi:predicted alternative tryptophan synthase beta-subunit